VLVARTRRADVGPTWQAPLNLAECSSSRGGIFSRAWNRLNRTLRHATESRECEVGLLRAARCVCVCASYVRCECDLWGCVRQRRVISRTRRPVAPSRSSGCRGAPRSATAVRGGMAQFKDQAILVF
jgi:hypothetical protein